MADYVSCRYQFNVCIKMLILLYRRVYDISL